MKTYLKRIKNEVKKYSRIKSSHIIYYLILLFLPFHSYSQTNFIVNDNDDIINTDITILPNTNPKKILFKVNKNNLSLQISYHQTNTNTITIIFDRTLNDNESVTINDAIYDHNNIIDQKITVSNEHILLLKFNLNNPIKIMMISK